MRVVRGAVLLEGGAVVLRITGGPVWGWASGWRWAGQRGQSAAWLASTASWQHRSAIPAAACWLLGSLASLPGHPLPHWPPSLPPPRPLLPAAHNLPPRGAPPPVTHPSHCRPLPAAAKVMQNSKAKVDGAVADALLRLTPHNPSPPAPGSQAGRVHRVRQQGRQGGTLSRAAATAARPGAPLRADPALQLEPTHPSWLGSAECAPAARPTAARPLVPPPPPLQVTAVCAWNLDNRPVPLGQLLPPPPRTCPVV